MPPLAKKSLLEELRNLEIEPGKKGRYGIAKRELEIEFEARNDGFEKGLEIFNATLKKLEALAKEHRDIGDTEIFLRIDQLSGTLGNLFWLGEQKEQAFLKFFRAICEKAEKKSG